MSKTSIKPVNIIISHVYSKDNKGDAALLSVLIKDIRKEFKNSYVYLTTSNLKRSIASIEANVLIFNSPINSLSQNKNLIYNDGSN